MLLLSLSIAHAAQGYLRYPDIHNDLIAFSAEGDIWTAPSAGGTATRLTSRSESEWVPKFSPDGRWLVYAASTESNVDTYLIPAGGGTPTRLTWSPSPEEPVGWMPDGKSVIVRGRGTDPNGVWRLYTVPVGGGDLTELPLGFGSRLEVDPATGLWAMTRLAREGATWKRYRGGSADDIWVGDPEKGDFKQVAAHDAQDLFPMWGGGRLWFLSDRGGTANLWSAGADGSGLKQHTAFSEWDARWPSMGPDGRIVFMYAGDLHVFDPKSGTEKKVEIDLPGDGRMLAKRYTDPLQYLSWFALAPDADRVLVTARGDLYSMPVKPGLTLPVTQGSGSRESYGDHSPDGKRVLYVTDAGGEESIVTADAWGRGEQKTVKASGKRGWHFAPVWSPDGKRVAVADETRTLYIIAADGSATTTVDTSTQGEITDYVWSPDGRYLAYSRYDERDFSTVWVYDTQDGKGRMLSTGSTSDQSPAWDPEGRYLYFLSARYVDPVFGERDFQAVPLYGTLPVAVLLRPDVAHPFADNAGLPPAPLNPAPQAKAEKAKKEKKKKDKKQKELELEATEQPIVPVVIQWEGIGQRQVNFPILPGNYGGLKATADRIFFFASPRTGLNPAWEYGPAALIMFTFEDRMLNLYMDRVYSYDLRPKAEQLAVLTEVGLYVFPTQGSPGFDGWESGRVRLEDLVLSVDPRAEWKQIYREAWRYQRDFFWDAGMSGLDWEKIRDQYGSLLDRIGSRDDLNDLIGEMIGELGTSHTYVGGGDYGYWIGGPGVGLLGATLKREGSAFKVERILAGDMADNTPSPLLEPGVGVKEGEYIVAVNNRPIQPDLPIDAMLQGLAGQRVMLTISAKATGEAPRYVLVTPLGSEAGLRRADWVRRNRDYIAQKTAGKVGYIHIPDMGAAGLVAFETWLYPQSDKAGLIIDVRYNRGGFVSQLILEKLRRPIDGWTVTRHGEDGAYPYAQRRGPFVVLTNEFAGSDGDIFPKAVQSEGLAPVIGARSWGGVIGIRGDKGAVDAGFLTQPEFAFYFKKGGWNVENLGVIPDIPVPMLPQDFKAGRDPQLDRAIEEVQRRIALEPPPPIFDPKPVKTREEFQRREKP